MSKTINVIPQVQTSTGIDRINYADIRATYMLDFVSGNRNLIQCRCNTFDFNILTDSDKKNVGLLLFSPNVDINGNAGNVVFNIVNTNWNEILYKQENTTYVPYQDGFKKNALYILIYNDNENKMIVLNL